MSRSPPSHIAAGLQPLRRLLGHRFAPIYIAIVLLVSVLFTLGNHTEVGSRAVASIQQSISESVVSHAVKPASVALEHVPDPMSIDRDYKWYSDAKIRALVGCLARGGCHANAGKIIIFNNWYCYRAVFEGYWGGEGTWCRGMKASLERQGYTVLFANHDWDYVMNIYKQFPDLVVALVSDDDKNNSPAAPYIKTKKNPHGLPAWKHFRFNYYPDDMGNRVGDRWVITCEPEWREEGKNSRNFTYIGYDLDDVKHTKFVPFEQRPYRAYVLGKHATFFYKDRAWQAWDINMYKKALAEMRTIYPDFEFVGAFLDERSPDEQKAQGPLPIGEGIKNMYPLNSTAFDDALTSSRMLVGIGWPTASPSPYRALARGVPFLSPFKVKEGGNPADPYDWTDSQHDSLRLEKPPLVYNVQVYDYDGFIAALKKGMETHVDPFVYERMTQGAMDKRVRDWIEGDHYAEAKRILDLRLAGKETQRGDFSMVFEL